MVSIIGTTLGFWLLSGTALSQTTTDGFAFEEFMRPPTLVSGAESRNLTGNGGEPYGASFASIVRVDVYEFLRDQFAKGRIPHDHPLYLLKGKMLRFGQLLREQDRVSAVDSIRDAHGEDVLARVIPRRSYFHLRGHERDVMSITDVEVLSSTTESGRVLELYGGTELSRLVFNINGASYVEVGAFARTKTDMILPAGMRFYFLCDDDSMQQLAEAGESIEILCGGYNLDGAVASLSGRFERVAKDSEDSSYRGSFTVRLADQSYVIEVNRQQLDHLREDASLDILQRHVFHEYLRLLGVDDEGFIISSQLEGLREELLSEPEYPYIGARVYVPRGAELLVESGENLIRWHRPLRTEHGKYGTLVYAGDLTFRNDSGLNVLKVALVEFEIVSGLLQHRYFLLDDITHIPKYSRR